MEDGLYNYAPCLVDYILISTKLCAEISEYNSRTFGNRVLNVDEEIMEKRDQDKETMKTDGSSRKLHVIIEH